ACFIGGFGLSNECLLQVFHASCFPAFGIFIKWFGVFNMTECAKIRYWYWTSIKPMRTRRLMLHPGFFAVFTATALSFEAMTASAETIPVCASGFSPGAMEVNSGNNHIQLRLDESGTMPFSQSAVKQGMEPAIIGPDPKIPYFTVRFAMPV